MNCYANLHTHSTHSDGKYTPTQLAQAAANEGYLAAALTDHDTVTGYPEFKAACDRLGLQCIFGAEFSSPCNSIRTPEGNPTGYHITGYHFDPEYAPMKQYLLEMGHRESDQTEVLFHRAIKEGLLSGITWDDVLAFNEGIIWLCNEHVFRTMKAKQLVTDIDYPHFFATVFGDRRNEVPPSYPFKQADEIVQMIRDAGGIAFVAHPHNQLQYIDALMEMGISGLEVWHPDLTAQEQVDALRIGLEKGLYISGGSDHSGLCGGLYASYADPKTGPHYIEPLCAGTTQAYFEEIRDRKIDR